MTKLSTADPFFGARLKVERANTHIREFESIVQAYVRANVKAMRPQRNGEARKAARRVGGHIPRYTPAIVGDAVHNLRSSLDHAYVALVEANRGTIDRHTKFPFGKKGQDVKGSVNGQVHRPAQAALDHIFNVIKPFEEEGSELYGVDRLDIADKHHLLIGTDAAMAIDRLDIIGPDGKPTGGGISGLTLVVPYGNEAAALGLGPGLSAKLQGDPHTTFDIRFSEGQPFENESVLKTLDRLHKLTGATVEDLSKFV